MHTRYLLTCGLFLLPVLGLLSLSALYLRNTGEFLSLPEVIAKQRAHEGICLYGTALHSDTLAYKVEGYRSHMPDVAVLGSSLTMQFRERFFIAPFYSVSGTVDTTVTGKNLMPLLLDIHAPKLLLFGIDFWWFPESVQPYRRSQLPLASERFTVDKLFQPLRWIASGKISVAEYVRVAFGLTQSERCAIGVQAWEKWRGYAADGSYYYTSVIEGHDLEGVSPKFEEELRDIVQGTGHYVHGSDINPQSMADLVDMIRAAEAAGTRVITFLQPVAPVVYAQMQRHPREFRFIDELRAALREAGIPSHDFLDPASVGTSDCEFVDGDHGGDVTYARLLRKIEQAEADPAVSAFINSTFLEETIAQNAGLAMARDSRVTVGPETDFMQMGCRKHPG